MREAAKHYLCSTCGNGWIVEEDTVTEPNPITVYDSGMFLQNLISIWKQEMALGDISDQYIPASLDQLHSLKNSLWYLMAFK